tara:strand:+ start:184 stop:378 length:195 start_codon:yes stop_codon:yes gene_type:complete
MNILRLFHCLWQSFIQFINFLGLKKRKLNSKNPRYLPKKAKKLIKERRLIIDLLFAQVYAVFYK